MNDWTAQQLQSIADTDDFHIAVYHADGKTTGTLTWIWSVVVDSGLYVRAYNGTNGRWYRSALEQGVGKITAAGQEYEVEFTPITDPELNDNIDAGYEAKYAGSPYLPPMIADKTRAATVRVTPR
ncbi:MAG TPA: DUF2255 family protein [Candidatus Yaniella excrementigallinarum]|nr:DUF2255 family protein [Candidatus Yaniella excrementigallinarum]